nr:hypothetical protein [Tanacetum cinerariifolium]
MIDQGVIAALAARDALRSTNGDDSHNSGTCTTWKMILESVKNGPLISPTIKENDVTRPRKYSELTTAKAIQADCDVKETNIILQGLPPKVYALGRQVSFATYTTRTYTPGASGTNSGKHRTVIYYNYKGEGHMSKQCTKPKRKQDDSWFKDKVLLVQAQANGQILYEEELAFLANPRITKGQATQTVITHNATYQANDLDVYNSNFDELNTAKVALMANLSHHGLDALVEKNLNVDVEPLALRFLNNKIVHSDYLRLTREQGAILREVVEQGKC